MQTTQSLRSAMKTTVQLRCPARRVLGVRTMHDNDPAILEQEKKRNMSGTQHRTSTPHKQHAPGWNEHLASASEASVKADKSSGTPSDLQKTTIEYIHSRHSPDEAHYAKDEVSGPLSGAQGSEDGSHPQVLVRETVKKTKEWTETQLEQTASEESVRSFPVSRVQKLTNQQVKADRNEHV
ncbi:unnamed protein product [Mycena citricolor]|uniref:Uncharacterized protein n=1 Tax=Mycena citricolor TaxID=2018698 RepID=A0AAD2Q2D9_9AGAR|nr:unnamed protein product [Mycena citricolor]